MGERADAPDIARRHADPNMTFVWFVIWLIANTVGAHEPLEGDPVNTWAATLILAVALDLAAAHAGRRSA